MRRNATPLRAILTNIRNRNSETLDMMAKRIGCSRSYLGMTETGDKCLSEKYISAICDIYDLSPEECANLRKAADISPAHCIMDVSILTYEQRLDLINTIRLQEVGKR